MAPKIPLAETKKVQVDQQSESTANVGKQFRVGSIRKLRSRRTSVNPLSRRSSRVPKPVIKSLREVSEDELMSSSSDDENYSTRRKSIATKKHVAKASRTSSTSTSQVKRVAPNSEEETVDETKKVKKDVGGEVECFLKRKDNDGDSVVEISNTTEERNKSEGCNGLGNQSIERKSCDESAGQSKPTTERNDKDKNFHEDGEEDRLWVEPNYKDKNWFKDNCCRCQVCNNQYGQPTDALRCFYNHKNLRRCYICFFVMKGGDDGDKRMFNHYQKRHPGRNIPPGVKCPYCSTLVPYISVPNHVISVHFLEALYLPICDQEKPSVKSAVQTVSISNKMPEETSVNMQDETGNKQKQRVVERVTRKRRTPDGNIYLVKWVGLDPSHNSWVPVSKLMNCMNLVEEYEKRSEKRRQRTALRKKRNDEVEVIENMPATNGEVRGYNEPARFSTVVLGILEKQPEQKSTCQQPSLPQQDGKLTTAPSNIVRKEKLKKLDEREYKILGIDT